MGVVTGVLNATVQWLYWTPLAEKILSITPTTPLEEIITWLLASLPALIAVAILVAIITWVIGTIVNGAVVKLASDTIEKGHASLRESLGISLSRLASLLGASIVSGLLAALGFLLFIVPGIILMAMFSLAVPVIIVEQKWCFESLGRSKKLVSKRWGKTFVLLLLIGIIFGIVGGGIGLLTTFLGAAGTIVSSLVMALVMPIMPIAITLLYYSMVARETAPPQR